VWLWQAKNEDQKAFGLAIKRRNGPKQYVICVNNHGCDDLQLRKVYEVRRDERARSEGLLRVIDESGEDYLYPEGCFLAIDLPAPVKRALAASP
jgi:hypothetical protein